MDHWRRNLNWTDPIETDYSPSAKTARAQYGDHFAEWEGMRFAALHLIVDLWGASGLDDVVLVRNALCRAVAASGATLLHLHLKRLEPTGGISGVALLAESHISIHTWPEHGYAAVDAFMCGDTSPYAAVSMLCRSLSPETVAISEFPRGQHSGITEARS